MPTFRLLLEYDGTEFEGWQVQPGDHRTVQGCLRQAFLQVTGGPARVTGASRTDAGVHAEGQVASARTERDSDPGRLQRALNGVLPRDVCVRDLTPAADDFDALSASHAKLYRYRVWNASARSPLRARSSAFVPQPLDAGAMRRAAASLVGRHDFASFRAAGGGARTSLRTLYRGEILSNQSHEFEFWFEADGFLRHMVRNLVGTLLEVGRGRRRADSMPELLAAVDRRLAGPTAPAAGLCLVRVRDIGGHSA